MGIVEIILIVVLVLAVVSALPGPTPARWHGYGWGPSGLLGFLVFLLLVLVLVRHL
jgi:uncharacterized membrane protein